MKSAISRLLLWLVVSKATRRARRASSESGSAVIVRGRWAAPWRYEGKPAPVLAGNPPRPATHFKPLFHRQTVTPNDSSLATALAGRYTIERELGQGGMATVYLAQDLRHRRRVAVKVLRPELAAT